MAAFNLLSSWRKVKTGALFAGDDQSGGGRVMG